MAGKHGWNTWLERSDGVGGWEALSDTTTIDHSDSTEALDVSGHHSPNKAMEFVPGMYDGGEVSVECNYVPGVTDAWTRDARKQVNTYRIVYRMVSPPVALTFDGFVTENEKSSPYDDKMEGSITFKVTGEPDVSELEE